MAGTIAPGLHAADPRGKPSPGTVVLPFGRVFAPRIDLLTRHGFKTTAAINGLSPFSAVDDPDPDMAPRAEGDRVTDRVRADVRKDLADRLSSSGADYLVLENSGALLRLREVNDRLYTILRGEQTDLMDLLWHDDPAAARKLSTRVSGGELSDGLRSAYDRFVDACLDAFDPSRIILIRSHAARFWVAEDGTVAPTTIRSGEAQLLEHLDSYFARRTGCLVSHAALGRPAVSANWRGRNPRLRLAVEADVVELIRSPRRGLDDALVAADSRADSRAETAADHVRRSVRRKQPIDADWLRGYFAAGGASYDDLLALAYLHQTHPIRHRRLVRACVRLALADPGSLPVAETRRRFEDGLEALRGWSWCSPELPSTRDVWRPQAVVDRGSTILRFRDDGRITRNRTSSVTSSDAVALVEGALPITPANLLSVLGSWPYYLERARRGITVGPCVTVPDADALVDSCYWLDWAAALEHERVAIAIAGGPVPQRRPDARTDLSFVFDPHTRVCTVGGGLMDQITHIALFDELCTPNGLEYVIDDFRYTWFRSHNGFEASRLAPDLEAKRMTRRVSQPLLESFRREVMRTRLPWVFNQSRAWHDFGLREAVVLTRDYSNSRRLVERGAPFPVRVYTTNAEARELMRNPPQPVAFFTSQHRMPMAAASADQLRRVFSYRHLEEDGLDPAVARMAEELRSSPHVAVHVRRGDYLTRRFDTQEWYFGQEHYIRAIDLFLESEFGSPAFDVAVFSDDLAFVEEHQTSFGLDRFDGRIRFVKGNAHYRSIYDSYLMSLCPVIIGSVGFFAATTSLLADPPSTFIRALPDSARIEWRRST